jgi:uncharacterized phage protein gp47/JayE
MTFGLTPQGFNAERLNDLINELNDAMVAQFGDINTTPQSVFGQIIGVMAKVYADLWENLNLVYSSQYPNSAFGLSLDNVVGLNGITRKAAMQTSVICSCYGNQDTFIPPGSLATIPGSNDLFQAEIGGTITTSACDTANVVMGAVTTQAYTISINSIPYIFSLPIITFTGNFVTSNSIIVSINGVQLPAVPYNMSSSQTITDIAAAIALDDAVASATPSGSTISIVPALAYSVTIDFISITGGASQPTYAITFAAPANVGQISHYLANVINGPTPPNPLVTATNNSGSVYLLTTSEEVPFSISVGPNLTLQAWSTPIQFFSQAYGPVACPQYALNTIVTPISGWYSIVNQQQGILGNDVETDAELRVRRQNSIFLLGLGSVQAITAQLINVPGVQASSVQVIENTSLVEDQIVITFSGPIVSGQSFHVVYNGTFNFTVAFDTDMATSMADLATQFLTLSQVATAVVSGVGSLILTLTFNPLASLQIASNGVTCTGTGTLPTAITAGGQPPKSIQAVVVGGTDQAIAQTIWNSKPAGISTFGTSDFVITDSQGNEQTIFFSRPTPIYIWIAVTLTLYTPETFPSSGLQLVAEQLNNYINNSLTVGETVLIQRVQAQCFEIPGIATATVTLAATLSQSDSPSFGSSSIVIGNTQIASTNLQLITVTV